MIHSSNVQNITGHSYLSLSSQDSASSFKVYGLLCTDLRGNILF